MYWHSKCIILVMNDIKQKEKELRQQYYSIVGKLNNHPALVNQDHVTIMGLMSLEEIQAHYTKLNWIIYNWEENNPV